MLGGTLRVMTQNKEKKGRQTTKRRKSLLGVIKAEGFWESLRVSVQVRVPVLLLMEVEHLVDEHWSPLQTSRDSDVVAPLVVGLEEHLPREALPGVNGHGVDKEKPDLIPVGLGRGRGGAQASGHLRALKVHVKPPSNSWREKKREEREEKEEKEKNKRRSVSPLIP